jgi:hypothetical protein
VQISLNPRRWIEREDTFLNVNFKRVVVSNGTSPMGAVLGSILSSHGPGVLRNAVRTSSNESANDKPEIARKITDPSLSDEGVMGGTNRFIVFLAARVTGV